MIKNICVANIFLKKNSLNNQISNLLIFSTVFSRALYKNTLLLSFYLTSYLFLKLLAKSIFSLINNFLPWSINYLQWWKIYLLWYIIDLLRYIVTSLVSVKLLVMNNYRKFCTLYVIGVNKESNFYEYYSTWIHDD